MNLSHERRHTVESAVEAISYKIRQRGNLPYVSVARQLDLLAELTQFELGRFLLQRGGVNGYWTDYLIHRPDKRQDATLGQFLPPLETFLLDQAPTCLATQYRFKIFKEEIQKRVQEDVVLASIPCGLSADLLDLDFSQTASFSIVGIDIDPDSLVQSQHLAKSRGVESHCAFMEKDAWALGEEEAFHVIASNGLSMYEPNDEKVVELYRQFFIALKKGGCLVTSFLTPPPLPGVRSEWNREVVNQEDALLQKIIFSDILECKWQTFRSEALVRAQLQEAGFNEIEVIYDPAHIFPTIIGKKL